jgi:DNA-3-methyladenine glycosylase II
MTELILGHYKSIDPKIYAVMKDLDYKQWLSEISHVSDDYFFALCSEIISQQLSGKAASAIRKKFLDLFPDKKPTPDTILALDDQTIRDAGLSWSKIKYIKDLATKVKNKEIDLANLQNLSDEEVIAELIKVKGIGKWTAEMFLMFTLRREDIFSFGDLGLNKGITKVYGIENPTPDQINEIISKWSPYKTYGSIALWRSLEV